VGKALLREQTVSMPTARNAPFQLKISGCNMKPPMLRKIFKVQLSEFGKVISYTSLLVGFGSLRFD
jgi:hypothetical protein